MKKFLNVLLAAALSLSALPCFAAPTATVWVAGVDQISNSGASNPLACQVVISGSAASASHPLAVQLSQGNGVLSATNPAFVRLTNGTNNIDATHPFATQLSIGNVAVDSTHGLYSNLLQGNAVVSSTNPVPARLTNGTNNIDATHPFAVQLSQADAALSKTNAVPVFAATSPYATYRYSSGYAAPVATATDVYGVQGSASKTVKIQRIVLNGTQTTAGINKWFLIKRSAADTGSTPVAMTGVPLDSASSAATAVAQTYTVANPTTGTAVGTIVSQSVLAPAPGATGVGGSTVLFDAKVSGQPIVLRGLTEELDVNFAGAAIPTGMSVSVDIETTEE